MSETKVDMSRASIKQHLGGCMEASFSSEPKVEQNSPISGKNFNYHDGNSFMEVKIGEGIEVNTSKRDTYQSANLNKGRGSILETAMTPGGITARTITEECLVKLPNGFQLTVGDAVRHGFIQKEPNGDFKEVSKEGELASVVINPQAAELSPAERGVEMLMKTWGPEAVDSLAQSYLRNSEDNGIKEFAESKGIKPEEFSDILEGLHGTYFHKAAQFLEAKASVPDGYEALKYINENFDTTQVASAAFLFFKGNPKMLMDMAREYNRSIATQNCVALGKCSR
jgi:hypothetical protein